LPSPLLLPPVIPLPPLPPPPLAILGLNHVSFETRNVATLAAFYEHVLGLQRLERPGFGFGGAWFALGSSGLQLHLIERDPLKPTTATSGPAADSADNFLGNAGANPAALPEERFIRRSHHLALTVGNIDDAKARLEAHKVPFAMNAVPSTNVVQLFFYDCDGNGVEIGNFNAGR
jgi:catechol 2,3-dioxygenase-like lactoylglutathione lyase family enzyme